MNKANLLIMLTAFGECLRRGHKLTVYQCGHCKKFVPTFRPDRQERGVKSCLFCDGLNVVILWASGKAKAVLMQ